ncbi:MerR family transcriptional regulator [Lachnospiraceae bacterium LCP25S3_G4]
MNVDRDQYFFTPRYTRGQVCNVMGITKDTLRYYEKAGILCPAEHKINHYKYYSIADLEILNVILFLRTLDVPVSEIPKFITCNDMDTYDDFLKEQIDKATRQMEYWAHVKSILVYLKHSLEAYHQAPNQAHIVQHTTFRVLLAQFDYQNYNIEQMVPSSLPNSSAYHVIKLKIVEQPWWDDTMKEPPHISVGYLCDEEEQYDDIAIYTIPKALMLITMERLDQIPKMIRKIRDAYKDRYEFGHQVYIIEHAFFNIFAHKALLRNLYFPIMKDL